MWSWTRRRTIFGSWCTTLFSSGIRTLTSVLASRTDPAITLWVSYCTVRWNLTTHHSLFLYCLTRCYQGCRTQTIRLCLPWGRLWNRIYGLLLVTKTNPPWKEVHQYLLDQPGYHHSQTYLRWYRNMDPCRSAWPLCSLRHMGRSSTGRWAAYVKAKNLFHFQGCLPVREVCLPWGWSGKSGEDLSCEDRPPRPWGCHVSLCVGIRSAGWRTEGGLPWSRCWTTLCEAGRVWWLSSGVGVLLNFCQGYGQRLLGKGVGQIRP